jgi:hypothetical protein
METRTKLVPYDNSCSGSYEGQRDMILRWSGNNDDAIREAALITTHNMIGDRYIAPINCGKRGKAKLEIGDLSILTMDIRF